MSGRALACVLGDMDLVRPLGRAGIPVAAIAAPGDPIRWSRYVRARGSLPVTEAGEEAAGALAAFAAGRRPAPVLFYEDDWHLLLVSRQRERLALALRFVVADAELVEDLMDKARFSALAERLGLPVPRAVAASPARDEPPGAEVELPVLLKPLPARNDRWRSVEPRRKAVVAGTRRELGVLWDRLASAGADVLVQELVPGPEHRIETYHVYVDEAGQRVADFTGRKLRTYPSEFGHSTALEISDAPDVLAAGRALVDRIGLTGVAKADFKRDDTGRLRLIEVNPRFNLWHHLGAAAGLNLPALVYGDLTGEPRPPVRRARPGTTWSLPWLDYLAVREQGASTRRWLRWVAECDARSVIAADDPLPFLGGKLLATGLRRLGGGR